MNIGQAVEAMRDAKRVARPGWNGKGMYVYIAYYGGALPCVTMHTAQGFEQPGWLCSQADLLATDWEVV